MMDDKFWNEFYEDARKRGLDASYILFGGKDFYSERDAAVGAYALALICCAFERTHPEFWEAAIDSVKAEGTHDR